MMLARHVPPRLIAIRVPGTIEEKSIVDVRPDDLNKMLHDIVGGDLEVVPHWTRWRGTDPCVAFCNEDGRMLGLPVNEGATLAWRGQLGATIIRTQLRGNVALVVANRTFLRKL